MPIQTPTEVGAVLAALDARSDAFEASDVQSALDKAVADPKTLSPDARKGWWAERAAFTFYVQGAETGPPWGTYFRPMMSGTNGDGSEFFVPDLREADAETLAYWTERAKAAKHPVLVARYADLVVDTAGFVMKANQGREKYDHAMRAIDAYVAAAQMDDGEAWGDTSDNLTRALRLALSFKDAERITAVVEATMEYVERTAKDEHIGTYTYLFDNLLPAKQGPELSEKQKHAIIAMFEEKFAIMTKPGGDWDVEPHGPRDIGLRLAGYYGRKGMEEDRIRVLRAIAEAFERRAKIGDPMMGVLFLADARKYYIEAGLRGEAERVQHEAQAMGPEAEKGLGRITIEHETPKADVDKFLDGLMEAGLDNALLRLAVDFIPDQAELQEHAEEVARDNPLYAMFASSPKMLGHGHIEADVGDETADPDGRMAHETSRYVQLTSCWIAWAFERMIRDGLTPARFIDFLRPCPLFSEDRVPLLQRGVEAHFKGDYIQAVHVLVPQIERAVVNLLPLTGKPSNKMHRTGRGVMQFKNLNDVLAREEWPRAAKAGGENLRMYLVAMLAHPKGLNIRNDVCHGLWPPECFTRTVSERVLHVLLAVSMVRPATEGTADHPEPEPPTGAGA